jgi:hypothetical protein
MRSIYKVLKKFKKYSVVCDSKHHFALYHKSKQLQQIQICYCKSFEK